MHDFANNLFGRRIRTYWNAVLIAATVSIGDMRADGDMPTRPPYAIVQLLPEAGEVFSSKERIGSQILTEHLHIGTTPAGCRITDFLN
ncbi:MAG: hypothetical protein ACR2OE_07850 [Thermomicrobiales bacterium]